MNQSRRKEIYQLVEEATDLQNRLQHLKDEEQEYYDNMPESLQGGEKGDTAQQHIDNMESACDSLEEAITYMNELL